jgi:hypothetical protein
MQNYDIMCGSLLLEHLPSSTQGSNTTPTISSRQVDSAHSAGAIHARPGKRCRVSDMMSSRNEGTDFPHENSSIVRSMNNRDYEDSHDA